MNKNIFNNVIAFVWFYIIVPKRRPTELPDTDNIIEIISHIEKLSRELSLNSMKINVAKE